MITLRGKVYTLRPLTLTEVGIVHESVVELGKCTPTIRVMEPEMLPHLCRVIAQVLRKDVPDLSNEEILGALSSDNITVVLLALSSHKPPNKIDIHQEHSNVRQ